MDDSQRDLYLRVLEHEQRIETRAFTTLGNFLTANAFVFAAWAAFYSSKDTGPSFGGVDWVLTFLAISGYLGGLAWAMLGARNWEYVRRAVGQLIRLGGKLEDERKNVYQVLRNLEVDVHRAWEGKWKLGRLSYHQTVISGTPLVVALLYVAMLGMLLDGRQVVLCGMKPWLLSLIVAAVLLVPAGIVYKRCRDSRLTAEESVRA